MSLNCFAEGDRSTLRNGVSRHRDIATSRHRRALLKTELRDAFLLASPPPRFTELRVPSAELELSTEVRRAFLRVELRVPSAELELSTELRGAFLRAELCGLSTELCVPSAELELRRSFPRSFASRLRSLSFPRRFGGRSLGWSLSFPRPDGL